MTNPFTAKAKGSKLKSFGGKKPAASNGKVTEKPKLRKFGGDRVTNVGKKQTEDWMIGKIEIQLEEHNNLWWSATITLDGESRVYHNKYGSWMTDRIERDTDWPALVTMKEAIPDLASTLTKYLSDELKALGRLKEPEPEKPKKRGKKQDA